MVDGPRPPFKVPAKVRSAFQSAAKVAGMAHAGAKQAEEFAMSREERDHAAHAGPGAGGVGGGVGGKLARGGSLKNTFCACT